jgi:hypothetical protein
MIANGYEVLPECLARSHNTRYAADKLDPACVCPGAQPARDEHLANRRTEGAARRRAQAQQLATAAELETSLSGSSVGLLLRTPHDLPPHLCVSEGWDPDLWFSVVPREQAQARSICGRCPVRATCEQAATDNGAHGVWGGTDEDDRRDVRNSWTQAS